MTKKLKKRLYRIIAGAVCYAACMALEKLVPVSNNVLLIAFLVTYFIIGGDVLKGDGFDNGAWVAPTVFTDCSDDMTIVREEIFGPVMSILTYESEDEVIRRANDTDYGLAAGIVTADLNRAHRVIHQLEAGICWINTWGESPAEMPVGGYKHSGIGRENGVMTLQSYTQVKSIQVEMAKFQSIF